MKHRLLISILSTVILATGAGISSQSVKADTIPSFIKVHHRFKPKFFGTHYNKKGDKISYYYDKHGVEHEYTEFANGATGDAVGFKTRHHQKVRKLKSKKPYKVILIQSVRVVRLKGSISKGIPYISGDQKTGHIPAGTKLKIAWSSNTGWAVYQKPNAKYVWVMDDYGYKDRYWFRFIK